MAKRGDEAFRADLRAVRHLVPGALTAGCLAGAVLVQGFARRNLRTNAAPDNAAARAAGRQGTWVTGDLARSIAVGEVDVAGALAGVEVGTDVPYGPRIEYGFVGLDSLGRRYHQAPQPFLRPAVDEHQAQIVREVREAFWESLRRARTGGGA